MTKYFNPTEYVLHNVLTYPLLYASPCLEDAKLKVFDQLFNVIGNGVRDDSDLQTQLSYSDINSVEALKLIGQDVVIYLGYRNEGISPSPAAMDTITTANPELFPDIKYWVDCPVTAKDSLYPNFDKKYSLVYRTNFKALGPAWVDAAIWYYSEALKYFEAGASGYSHAFPCATEAESKAEIAQFENLIVNLGIEQIVPVTPISYDGDPVDYLTNRWAFERDRIISFIHETIEMLKS